MKKITMILLVLMFALYGCTSEKADDKSINDLKTSIDDITSQLFSLQEALEIIEFLNTDLEDRFGQLKGENEELEKQFIELQKQKGQLQVKINDLTNQLAALEQSAGNVKLFLAEEYYLVPGDNFQLFYRSIVQAVNPYGFYIKLTGSKGHAYNRYYEWKPESTDAGKTYSLKVEICDNLGKVLTSATTNLIVSNVTSEANPKTILCIGDSLTYNGYWVSYGAEKYKTNGGSALNFIGTNTGGYNGKTYKFEGRSGWQWSNYMNYQDSPFASTTTPYQISFKDYCTKNGFSDIDELYILLTWNGIGGRMKEFNLTSEPLLSAKKLIDQFHKDFPNAKITLLGIPQPSVNAGLGAYYEINLSYGDNYGQFVTALNYNKALENFAKMDGYKDFMRYIDVKAQFDSEYNMPSAGKPVNNHSSTTEPVGTAMGMHPSTEGYLQIGDVFYRALAKKWN